MSPAVEEALNTLRRTGSLVLPGRPAIWSSGLRILFVVLLALVGLVIAGSLVALPVAAMAGVEFSLATIFGALGANAMLVAVAVLLVLGLRRRGRFRATERQDFVIEAHGITLRGVGPIPWADFGPAEHRMVPSEHSSGYTRRAVMELTEPGLRNVNHFLSPELREHVSPAMGPVWNRHHRYIYVPGIDGMRQSEVIHLINEARQLICDLGRPSGPIPR